MNDQWTATETIAKGQAVMLRADGTVRPAPLVSPERRIKQLVATLERIRTIAADPKFDEDSVLRVRLDMIVQMAERAVKECGEGRQ